MMWEEESETMWAMICADSHDHEMEQRMCGDARKSVWQYAHVCVCVCVCVRVYEYGSARMICYGATHACACAVMHVPATERTASDLAVQSAHKIAQ